MLVAGIKIFVTEYSARNDTSNWFIFFQVALKLLHNAVLHGTGVRRCNKLFAVLIFLSGHERIVVIPSGVTFWKIQTGEHVPIVINLPRFYRCKAHSVKDIEY